MIEFLRFSDLIMFSQLSSGCICSIGCHKIIPILPNRATVVYTQAYTDKFNFINARELVL